MNSLLSSTPSYLGIDWGEKKVGVAIADSETRLAFPIMTLPNDAALLQKLAEIVAERNVRAIVIGVPSYVNRDEKEYGGEILGRVLEREVPVPVFYENEMFTTKLARERLIERGVRRNLDAKDDAEAARIILEEWLLNAKDATMKTSD